MPDRSDAAIGRGVLIATVAYLLWGVFPLYFLLLAPTGPIEVVAWRVVTSLVFLALLITVTRGWGRFARLVRDGRALAWLGLASVLLAINWTTFVSAAITGQIVETSLGYFINPVLTVLLGVVVLRESLRPLQWAAVAISVVAVIVITVGYGEVPWIALILAGSFGIYGLAKNRVGRSAGALSGLAAETLLLSPVAVIVLIVIAMTTGLTMGANGSGHTLLLIGSGAVSAIPLLLFAAGARRIPLSYLGLLQYLAPVIQFLLGVFLLHEPMPTARWIGFGIVWVALVLLALDTAIHGARRRRGRVTDLTDGIATVT